MLTDTNALAKAANVLLYKILLFKQNTNSAITYHLANSHEGQYIHFIVNNGPYQAKYDSSFQAKLNKNSNTVLAFLSRSFHENIKHKNAFILKQYVFENEQPKIDIKKDPL